MKMTGGRTHDFGDVVEEGGDIMPSLLLEVGDPFDVECSLRPDFLQVLLRNLPALSASLGSQDLDPEPVRVFGLVTPNRGHLRPNVAVDHNLNPCASSFLKVRSLSRSSGRDTPRICTARIAALIAPSSDTVATGTPEGIWTVE